MKRGDIYWVNLDPTIGKEIKKLRPCVLVGATPINKARSTVVIVPLSSNAVTPKPPLTVPVTCLGRNAVAVCDQIRAIDKSRLVNSLEKTSIAQLHPVDQLSLKDLHALDDALRQVLSL